MTVKVHWWQSIHYSALSSYVMAKKDTADFLKEIAGTGRFVIWCCSHKCWHLRQKKRCLTKKSYMYSTTAQCFYRLNPLTKSAPWHNNSNMCTFTYIIALNVMVFIWYFKVLRNNTCITTIYTRVYDITMIIPWYIFKAPRKYHGYYGCLFPLSVNRNINHMQR